MGKLRLSNDSQVKVLAFLATSLGVVAASDGNLLDPKLIAGAIAAGCGAVLALMRSPGQPRPPGLPERR